MTPPGGDIVLAVVLRMSSIVDIRSAETPYVDV